MRRRKLNYRFHDPNEPAAAAEYIWRLFVDVNQKKVEEAVRKKLTSENHQQEGQYV